MTSPSRGPRERTTLEGVVVKHVRGLRFRVRVGDREVEAFHGGPVRGERIDPGDTVTVQFDPTDLELGRIIAVART